MKNCLVCYLTKPHPVCEDELIYKMLSCSMVEHLPTNVWDTDTLVTNSAMVNRSLLMVSRNQYFTQVAQSMHTHIRCGCPV